MKFLYIYIYFAEREGMRKWKREEEFIEPTKGKRLLLAIGYWLLAIGFWLLA